MVSAVTLPVTAKENTSGYEEHTLCTVAESDFVHLQRRACRILSQKAVSRECPHTEKQSHI